MEMLVSDQKQDRAALLLDPVGRRSLINRSEAPRGLIFLEGRVAGVLLGLSADRRASTWSNLGCVE